MSDDRKNRGRRRRGPKARPEETEPAPRPGEPTLARLIAVRVLERVDRSGAYADRLLHHGLAQSQLPAPDRAMTTELVYGTLRWRGRLDYALSQLLDEPLAKLQPGVLQTLRVGAYQILHTDRIPDSAAVDQAVRCARALGLERATGLVNAVLRRLIREGDTITFPSLEDDPVLHLQHALSLPQWIAERWLEIYGAESAARLAETSNATPPHVVRSNRLRQTRQELALLLGEEASPRLGAHAPDALVLAHRGDPGLDPLFREGRYTIQDEASQLVVSLLDPQPGDHVLDTCAGPGTKTTAIAERLCESGSVLALDRNQGRLTLVSRDARRVQVGTIHCLVRDATRPLQGVHPPSESGTTLFDRVLVDAPCSGLGTLRRNPDARWRVRPEDPATLSDVQTSILREAAAVLKVGGTLVYSTCTLLPEENEKVVEKFLAENPDFALLGPASLPEEVQPFASSEGFMRCLPHEHDMDGFFGARMTRTAPPTAPDTTSSPEREGPPSE